MSQTQIESGKTYWVDYAGARIKVVAVRPSPIIPDWWWCMSEHGQSAMFPSSTFSEPAEPPAV